MSPVPLSPLRAAEILPGSPDGGHEVRRSNGCVNQMHHAERDDYTQAPLVKDLPSLRRTFSPSYMMPLPLYGSGLRTARTSAANWPTFCLSAPLITMVFGSGTSTVTPSGGVLTMIFA